MRIALVVGRFPVVSEVFVLQQVTGLLDLGADVEIFSARPPPGEVTHELYRAYDLAARTRYTSDASGGALGRLAAIARGAASGGAGRLSTLAGTLWRSTVGRGRLSLSSGPARRLLDVIERGPFDVVHAHFGDSGRLCAALPRRAAKLVTSFHGYDANVAPRLEGLGIYNELFSRGDAFTVNSRFLRGKLAALGCPEDRITILPMGVDVGKVAFTPRSRQPGEPVKLLTVGRLVPAKGVAYAIRAVAELLARGASVRYLVVGDGEERGALEALIRELGVAEHVTLAGPKAHEDVCALYDEAHVFVLPSVRTGRGDEEAQGLVVAEAQASGLPVIVTDIGGVAEGIAPGESGLVCRAADAGALASAVLRLIERASEWPSMGAAGRRLVEASFCLPRLNRDLLALYQSLTA